MTNLRPKFWETVPLSKMTTPEWEALCDGCGKCCLNKIEYEDTGEVEYTRVACRLLDNETCRCSNYARRFEFVPECIRLNPKTLKKISYWLPATCAYKLLQQGKPLPEWHPLRHRRSRTLPIHPAIRCAGRPCRKPPSMKTIGTIISFRKICDVFHL